MKNSLSEIDKKDSLLLIIDMQDKLLSSINETEKSGLIKNVNLLIKCADLYSMPIFITEQYPAGLGSTTVKLNVTLENKEMSRFEKMHFSIFKDDKIRQFLEKKARKNIIIAGIESHICVLQSALDLISNGFKVVVCSDAIASRNEYFKEEALRIMRSSGIHVCPSETIAYMFLEKAGTPEFKSVLPFVK